MQNWLTQTKREVQKIAMEILKKFPAFLLRFAFVGYRDVCDKEARFAINGFSSDFSSLETSIRKIEANGGGDTPEDIFGALLKVASLEWLYNHRVLIHICDAPCHGKRFHDCDDTYPEGDPEGHTLEEVLRTLKAKNVHYYFLAIKDSTTSKMTSEFKSTYEAQGGVFHKLLLGDNVAGLLVAVIQCVVTSVMLVKKKKKKKKKSTLR
eukprot:TRINITY_DN6443_c0_g1_i2.p1 TRINITY_DN6443_c0_g1~~TRINITY_DN6443_c0_g1_i2.p1  ORF type:complete len:208 (-),score=40.07 TRINITY_DN6443_c0_g1_i2:12-635(-)